MVTQGHVSNVLDRLSTDPHGYSDPVNRAIALMVSSLRKQGVEDWVIYTAAIDVYDALDVDRP